MKPRIIALSLFLLPPFFNALIALPTINLTVSDAQKIARRVANNEIKNTLELTCWKQHEDHVSLGIGHWTWYPTVTKNKRFGESFPELIAYLEQHGKPFPRSVCAHYKDGCPWATRKEFCAELNSKRMKTLRAYLLDSLDLQVRFMTNRLNKGLKAILASTINPKEKAHILRQCKLLIGHDGLYAMIDYLNFKGEGLGHIHYNNHRWGLKQVLLEMKEKKLDKKVVNEFARAAEVVITRRIDNAPTGIKEKEETWRRGWLNRINTYRAS